MQQEGQRGANWLFQVFCLFEMGSELSTMAGKIHHLAGISKDPKTLHFLEVVCSFPLRYHRS